MNRKKTVIYVFLTIWAVAAVLAAMSTGAFAAEPKLITTESELKEALHNASEGDTILVGDIEFAYSPMGMTLSKGVTIKSGKNTPAVFSGGAFAVMGCAGYLLLDAALLSELFENFLVLLFQLCALEGAHI